MELKIDFGDPIIGEELVLSIQPSDLDDFYVSASDLDKGNAFCVLLASLHAYEAAGDARRAAHLSFLAAYYLFVTFTPPGSFELALHYIEKAVALDPTLEHAEWLELVRRGN